VVAQMEQLAEQGEQWSLAVSDVGLRGAGRWEQFTYSGPPGSRRYFVYTPANYTLDRRVPLVVMLHGCTQSPDDSAAGTQWNQLADQKAFIAVYPQQTSNDNLNKCWNWFLPAHQARGEGEAGIIAGITQQVLASDTRWNIDPDQVFVAGLSAGAAMTVLMGVTYPDLYAAIGVHSGLEYQAATNATGAYAAMTNGGPDPVKQGKAAFDAMGARARLVPTIVFHGTKDRIVRPVNGDQVVQQWMETNRLASGDKYNADFAQPSTVDSGQVPNGFPYKVSRWNDEVGNLVQEYWQVDGMDHAWSGGSAMGSYSDPRGPSATEAMYEFFSAHPIGL
jgi:poly(hydroxyalkanoate) depolymerase family esterase